MPRELTAEHLRKILSYSPESGEFRRLVATNFRTRVGQIAGYMKASGYRQIKIDGFVYLAHRLAFLYMTGKFPSLDVDHMDGNPSNNRWANLREASASQNVANSRRHRDNTSGFKGVTWHKRDRKWRAQIGVMGKYIYLGQFSSPADAHAAYTLAATRHFGNFARTA